MIRGRTQRIAELALAALLGCTPGPIEVELPPEIRAPAYGSALIAFEHSATSAAPSLWAVSLSDASSSLPSFHYDESPLTITVFAYASPLSALSLVPGPIAILAMDDTTQFARPIPPAYQRVESAAVVEDRIMPWQTSTLSRALSAIRIVDPNGSDPCRGFEATQVIEPPEDALDLRAVIALSNTQALLSGERGSSLPKTGVLGTLTASGSLSLHDSPPPLTEIESLAFDPLHQSVFASDPIGLWAELDLSGATRRTALTPTTSRNIFVAAGSDGTALLSLYSGGLYQLTAGSTIAVRWDAAPPHLRSLAVVRRDRIAAVDFDGKVYFFDGNRWTMELDTTGSRHPFAVAGNATAMVMASSTELWIRNEENHGWMASATDVEFKSLAMTVGGGFILAGAAGVVSWWNGRSFCTLHTGAGRGLNAIAVSPDGRWAAVLAGLDSNHAHSAVTQLALPAPP